ncbi:hypothetical protein V6N13_081226 [Hibiscus sabdariffa]
MQPATVSAYEGSNQHIDEKLCTCLRTTDNIACHPTTDAASELHPLDAFIISTRLKPERRVFHATRVKPLCSIYVDNRIWNWDCPTNAHAITFLP